MLLSIVLSMKPCNVILSPILKTAPRGLFSFLLLPSFRSPFPAFLRSAFCLLHALIVQLHQSADAQFRTEQQQCGRYDG